MTHLRMPPEFMLIGASKCATSSIIEWLRRHPSVFVTQPKEPGFFNRDEVFAKGLDWYYELYRDAKPGQVRGEGSNLYTAAAMYPETVGRVKRACPHLRLVYVVRDPIARIRSLWIQIRAQAGGDHVDADINKAIYRQYDTLIDTSLYYRQLQIYLRHYNRTDVHIALYEEFRSDPLSVMKAICKHIGVDPDELPSEVLHVNPSGQKTLVSPWLGRLRRWPASRTIRRLMPEGMKAIGRSLLPRVQVGDRRSTLTAESRSQIAKWVSDDSTRMLDLLDRPHGIWPTLGVDWGSGVEA